MKFDISLTLPVLRAQITNVSNRGWLELEWPLRIVTDMNKCINVLRNAEDKDSKVRISTLREILQTRQIYGCAKINTFKVTKWSTSSTKQKEFF